MTETTSGPSPDRAPLPDAWFELPLQQRRIIAAVVALVLVIAAWQGVTRIWDAITNDEPIPAVFVAGLAPTRVATWERLAECESENRWDLDTGNGFFGGLQFTLSSWQEVGGEGSPAAAARNEQIMRAEFLHERQGWGAWPACAAQLGLED